MIRNLMPDDIPAVLDLMRELSVESPIFKHYPHSAEYVEQQLLGLITASGINTIMLFDEKTTGIMFGYCGCPWWSPFYEANEMLLAIPSENRGGSAAVRLIREFERIAQARYCRAVNAGSSLGINDPGVEALYLRLGYTKRGHGFTKRLD